MAADLKLAQSSNAALAQLIELQDLALVQWRQVVQRCDGRARERAERLLADNERARGLLAEREQAGAQCEISFRDAQSMQELAKTAFGERRWTDAGALYRKAETLWDLAAEHCTGEQQAQAGKRREEAELDGHNAEQCAPSFDRARDFTGRLRAVGATAPPADRERASQIAETAWREATALCKGQALDLAKANSEALARERGTPWVVTHGARANTTAAPARGSGFATVAPPPVAASPEPATKPAAAAAPVAATVPVAAVATGAALGAAAGAAAGAVAAAPAPSMLSRLGGAAQQALKTVKAATGAEVGAAAAPAAAAGAAPSVGAAAPLVLPAGEVELRATTARYVGRFALDGSQRISGEGRVEWTNGDRYEGVLQAGQRQGQGRFTWANGQSFEGDWLNDEPQGRGILKFAGGDVYEGQVKSGQPQGEGEMRYASGDRFKGNFRNGSPHGRGQYRWANGQSFEGDWNGLIPQGRGVLRFANGNVYEGDVKEGQPEGAGRMQYANGGVYEGQFLAGLAHGKGKYVWPGGDRYEGAWEKGRKHGQGTFFFASGERWVGRFEDDERSDDGVFHGK